MAFESQSEYESYSDVPVMRRRWFFVLTVLFLIPLGIILAFSGDMYAYTRGEVVKYPKSLRMGMAVFWLALILLGIMQIVGM